MATEVGIKELLEAGVHFGHQTRRWNPKMRRFIHGERAGIYIIDLLQTQRLLEQAQDFATELARRGGTILFVGTKKQARDAVKEVAESAGMPYVNNRWLGGLLTNFQTINQRIRRLHDLERYETEGQLELLPTRERMAAQADLAKLRAQPRRRQAHAAHAGRLLHHRPQDRGDRRARGPAPAHPDHRPRRHELRPGRHRLRRPGQRRRDPLVLRRRAGDRRPRRRGHATPSAPRRTAPRQEAEEQARRQAEERARLEAEEQARRQAAEQARRDAEAAADDRGGRAATAPPPRPRSRQAREELGREQPSPTRRCARARRPDARGRRAAPSQGPGEPAPPALDPTPDPASPPASEVARADGARGAQPPSTTPRRPTPDLR